MSNQIKYYKDVINDLCRLAGIENSIFIRMIQDNPSAYLKASNYYGEGKRSEVLVSSFGKEWDDFIYIIYVLNGKADAIKQHRDTEGGTMKEARKYVDDLISDRGLTIYAGIHYKEEVMDR